MWELDAPWWTIVVRAVLVYGVLLTLIRLSGKRTVGEFTPFDDTIEELSGWYAYSPEYLERKNARRGFGPGEPASNPYREVGRNDPCPCGSGKKFKKCCLA